MVQERSEATSRCPGIIGVASPVTWGTRRYLTCWLNIDVVAVQVDAVPDASAFRKRASRQREQRECKAMGGECLRLSLVSLDTTTSAGLQLNLDAGAAGETDARLVCARRCDR